MRSLPMLSGSSPRVSGWLRKRGLSGTRRRAASHGARDAKALIKRCEELLQQECLARAEAIARDVAKLADGWERSIRANAEFIAEVTAARADLRSRRWAIESRTPTPAEATGERDTLRFQVSSRFLMECWRYLTADEARRERLHLVSGTITPDGLRVLSCFVPVKLVQQSAAYVKADTDDYQRTLVELTERDGHPLLAMCHSHITKGPASTQPSATDLANQDRFVRLGCEAIGGIFSLDGYVRFFSTMKDIDIEVFGKNVQLVEERPREKVFKLECSQ